MSENVPLVLCVAAIWVAWSVHDYLQEAIFLTPGFDFPLTMALTLQSVASLLAFVQRSLSTALEPVAPADALTRRTFGWYLALSFLIASANGLSTAALSFVSMATKVLFKSSKIVVVMLIGAIAFGRRYSAASFASMVIVCAGLVVFFLGGSRGGVFQTLANRLPSTIISDVDFVDFSSFV